MNLFIPLWILHTVIACAGLVLVILAAFGAWALWQLKDFNPFPV